MNLYSQVYIGPKYAVLTQITEFNLEGSLKVLVTGLGQASIAKVGSVSLILRIKKKRKEGKKESLVQL